MKKINKILIANRGEIAVRIIRTCRELGIHTVSVYSDVDENSLHVKLADESVCIGPAKSTLSYLNIPSILSAAEITGADAIHPGFGFLSENEEFSKLCTQWGIIFIGPSLFCLAEMGDKIRSKELAMRAKVPTLDMIKVTGSIADIKKRCKDLGYPVLIKASAGGGGRGMAKIEKEEDLERQIERLKEESKNAFGDDTLFIEKYIASPRHIEVQILGDQQGNIVHLGERDCTVQRRSQKVVEESPSPILTEKERNDICEAAVRLAKTIEYYSAGTVEFLFDQEERKFYFMEMNTRIQVEHPVTEVRTQIDLIAQQIFVAAGNSLGFSQKDIQFQGHSIEVRINAEDPVNYRPSPGRIQYYYRPAGPGVRVDDFIYSGYTVLPFYDSMLAKVITFGRDRDDCLRKMNRALRETVIEGIKTNIPLLEKIIQHSDFVGNNYSTRFLENIH